MSRVRVGSSRVRAVVGVGALVLLGVAARSRAHAPTTAPTQRAVLAAPDALRRYAFEYAADESSRLDAPSRDEALVELSGRVRLAGELVLTPARGPRADRRVWALRAQLSRAELVVSGRAQLADLAAARRIFDNAQVLVETDLDGMLRAVHERDDDPVIARQTLRQLALELTLVRRPGDAWDVAEPAPHGTARSRYAWATDGVTLRRARDEYASLTSLTPDAAQSVHGEAAFTFGRDGALASLDGDERIDVGDPARPSMSSHTHLALRLTASRPTAPMTDLSAFAPRRVDRPTASREMSAQHLAQRVDGLTVDAMIDTLNENLAGGIVPDHDRFFWRATGLLALHPEAAEVLGTVFRDPRASARARGLVLDLLARSGTPEAQRVLVALLDGPDADGPSRPHYLQRLGFVRAPSPETLDLATRAMDRPDTRAASFYVLGSLAHTLSEEGRGDESARCNARLLDALSHAQPGEARHLLAALGNARRDENAAALAPYAHDPDVAVRSAAARALAVTGGDESTEALWSMLDDAEADVQELAIAGLRDRALDASRVTELAARVRDGRLSQRVYVALAGLLRAQSTAHHAAVLACLETMVAQDVHDGPTRATVYALLTALRAA